MNKQKIRITYLLLDIFAALVVWTLFMYFRKTVNDASFFNGTYVFVPNYNFYTGLLLFPYCCLFIYYLSGFYLYPQFHKKIDLFLPTLISSFIISIVIFFVILLDDLVVSYEFYYKALLVLFGLLFTVTYFFRLLVCTTVRRKYRLKQWTIPTAIIGTGKNAQKISSEIKKRMINNTFIGYISEYKNDNKEQVLGSVTQIDSIIKTHKIQEIIIAFDDNDESKLFSLINSLYKYGIDIKFTPGLYEILIGSVKIKELGVSPLVSITTPSMRNWELAVKHTFDITMSALALIICSPLFIFFAIRIKADSSGPVFFKQERIGQFGKAFNIIKFRTMRINAENGTPQLSAAEDKRVTSFGRFLRKYRLDELPQFWNILKGEMSIVGPRPERAFYIKKITKIAPYYCLVFKVRPGLTSWGPIHIGYSDTIEKMVERLNYDVIYIENMSLRTDIKILLYTIEVILKGKGV